MGVGVFVIAYTMQIIYVLPTLWYYPLLHMWRFESAPIDLAMAWYGRTFTSFLGASVATLGTLKLSRYVRPRHENRWFIAVAILTLALFVIAMIITTTTTIHRSHVALPESLS